MEEQMAAKSASRLLRLERFLARVFPSARPVVRWLHKPSARWIRIPAGAFFCAGGVLALLPFFGLWMLPLGLMLLSHEIPIFGRATDRVLDWIERHRPHWFAPESEFDRVG